MEAWVEGMKPEEARRVPPFRRGARGDADATRDVAPGDVGPAGFPRNCTGLICQAPFPANFRIGGDPAGGGLMVPRSAFVVTSLCAKKEC